MFVWRGLCPFTVCLSGTCEYSMFSFCGIYKIIIINYINRLRGENLIIWMTNHCVNVFWSYNLFFLCIFILFNTLFWWDSDDWGSPSQVPTYCFFLAISLRFFTFYTHYSSFIKPILAGKNLAVAAVSSYTNNTTLLGVFTLMRL